MKDKVNQAFRDGIRLERVLKLIWNATRDLDEDYRWKDVKNVEGLYGVIEYNLRIVEVEGYKDILDFQQKYPGAIDENMKRYSKELINDFRSAHKRLCEYLFFRKLEEEKAGTQTR